MATILSDNQREALSLHPLPIKNKTVNEFDACMRSVGCGGGCWHSDPSGEVQREFGGWWSWRFSQLVQRHPTKLDTYSTYPSE